MDSVITGIESYKKVCRIYLNDEYAFSLYPSEVRTYHLHEGDTIAGETIEQIYSAVLSKRAKLRCMHILQHYDRTEQQLRRKLKEDAYPQQIIDEALSYVKSYGYVDDLRFATQYIAGRQEKKSAQQLKAELMAKGIDDGTIAQALEEAYEQSEEDLIRYWLEKKQYDPDTADEAQKQKMIQFLLRKGLHYSEIKKLLT